MARLFHTKITDLSALSYSSKKRDEKYIRFDDLALMTNKLNNYKCTINELSTCLEIATLKSDNEVKGNWNFARVPYLYNNSYKAEDVLSVAAEKPNVMITKETVDWVYDWYLGILNDLSTFIYHRPRLISYIGMRLITTLKTEAEVIEKYGGVKWVQTYTGAFIAGANTEDKAGEGKYHVDEVCNLFNSDYRLKTVQGGLQSHSHTMTSSVGGESSKVSYMTYPDWSGNNPKFGRHGHKSFASQIGPPASWACTTSVGVTINDNCILWGEDAKESYDNRPEYQCFYIWKRIA